MLMLSSTFLNIKLFWRSLPIGLIIWVIFYGLFFTTWVVVSCFFSYLIIFYCLPDIVYFALLRANLTDSLELIWYWSNTLLWSLFSASCVNWFSHSGRCWGWTFPAPVYCSFWSFSVVFPWPQAVFLHMCADPYCLKTWREHFLCAAPSSIVLCPFLWTLAAFRVLRCPTSPWGEQLHSSMVYPSGVSFGKNNQIYISILISSLFSKDSTFLKKIQ